MERIKRVQLFVWVKGKKAKQGDKYPLHIKLPSISFFAYFFLYQFLNHINCMVLVVKVLVRILMVVHLTLLLEIYLLESQKKYSSSN